MRTPHAVVQAWVAAYNARDAQALTDLYHDELLNHPVAGNESVVGRPAILRAAKAFFRGFPDICIHAEIVLQNGDWTAYEWAGKATWLGDFAEGSPNGRVFTPSGVVIVRIFDGMIRSQCGRFDGANWLAQLGIPRGEENTLGRGSPIRAPGQIFPLACLCR